MTNDNLLQYVTVAVAIIVAIISLLGNVMQFIVSPKAQKNTAQLELTQSIKTIAETYDKLLTSLNGRVAGFEEELKLNNKIIEELTKVKIDLEAKLIRQEELLEDQRKEIDKLKKELADLKKVITQPPKMRRRRDDDK